MAGHKPFAARPAIALARAVAGYAVADAIDPAELLGVEVDQFTRLLALVADDRHGRVESLEPASSIRRRTLPTVETGRLIPTAR